MRFPIRILIGFTAALLAVSPVHPQAADANTLFQRGSAAFAAGRLEDARNAFGELARRYPNVGAAHTALGTVLLAEGKQREALNELTTAHRLSPRDIQTLLTLGTAQEKLSLYREAAASFHSAVANGATLSNAETLAFATSLSALGSPAEAQAALENAIQAGPPSAQLLDALGTVMAQQKQYDKAEAQLKAALRLDDRYARAHAHLGSVLLSLGQPQQAAVELRTTMELGYTSSLTAAQRGRALILLQQDDEAVTLLEHAASADKRSVDLAYALALAYQDRGDTAKSLPLFAQVTAARPVDVEALTNYGLALVQHDEAAAALKVYRQALAHGDNPVLRQNIGVAYLQQNDEDRAIAEFHTGLQQAPQSAQLHYDLGLALKLKDDAAGAAVELRKAQQLDPQLSDAAYTLGVLEMQQGQLPEAVQQLEHVVELQPLNGEAWSLLGSAYRQSGDTQKAIEALRHAIQLQPDQPAPHITLASALVESGDRAGGTEQRKIAAELSRTAANQQRAELALRTGRALLAQGNASQALAQFQTAVTAAPNSADTHRELAEALRRTGQSDLANAEMEKAAALQAHTP